MNYGYSKLKCPSKTFLAGEYAVLAGGPALLIATPPYFSSDSEGFYDPYDGIGGFGASGAKFAMAAKNQGMTDPLKVWGSYQKSGLSGSGSDVVCQWMGGMILFHPEHKKIEKINWPFDDLMIGLIHTGKKINTHEYLAENNIDFDVCNLNKITGEIYHALKNNHKNIFLENITAYKNALKKLNLLSEYTQKIITKLNDVDFILASKGCGAMGNDVVLVIIPKDKQMIFTQYCETEKLNLIFCDNQFAHGVRQYD